MSQQQQQQQHHQQQQQQPFINAALPPGYPYYYAAAAAAAASSMMPSGCTQYGAPVISASAPMVSPAANSHGAGSSAQFQKPAGYASHSYGTGYDDLTQGQDYKSSGYSAVSQSANKSAGSSSGHAGVANSCDLQMNPASAYGKVGAQVGSSEFAVEVSRVLRTDARPTTPPDGAVRSPHAAGLGVRFSSQRPSQAAGPPKIPPGKPHNITGYWAAN
ncbi:PREDICTED: ubiquitin-associated protein 2-like [Priapulus caudatus]|uniref:Ubiquitin-associated protein 2-like n=1 Tax=Priapulus caudatus TaxID=37621 RepID=A0ABM1EQZ9_PRICU|nr:PREDICTED: ubiquitin-associated protein 2-like [Priapulus caudatus]